MTHNFFDKSVIAGVKRRESDGALIADVRIARTGMQYYIGSEVDKKNEHGYRDARVVRVYRPGEEVFSEDTMKSAAHRPVTNEHPRTESGLLDTTTWAKFAKGNTADEVSAEGIFIRVPLIISDESTIRDVESGKREVSAGYTSVMDWTPGVTPSGESYDAVQRQIRFNHVAVVQRGRAGSAVRIGDAAMSVEDGEDEGDHLMTTSLKTVTVDGLSIEVTDQGAQVIGKLQATIDSMSASSTKVIADHAIALADKDKELAKKDAEIADLRTKVLDAASLDKLVSSRATLVADAKLVHKDAKTDGLDSAAIKKGVVLLALGDAAIADKSEAYIDARFDVLVEAAKKTPASKDAFRAASTKGLVSADADNPAAKAYADMIADYSKSSATAATN